MSLRVDALVGARKARKGRVERQIGQLGESQTVCFWVGWGVILVYIYIYIGKN